MRIVGRLLALFGIGVVVSAAVGAIAAQRAKRDFVPIDDPEANEIRLAAIFGPLSFRSTAASFRGGTVDFRFGGGVIDLREAVLDPAGARLDVMAFFGGGQILVPEGWRVTTRVMGIGGAGDARPRIEREEDAPHLTIEGTAIFGGFGVASEMPEAAARGLEEAVAKAAARHEHADATVAASHEPADAESPEVVPAG
jgi:hypothetical protein